MRRLVVCTIAIFLVPIVLLYLYINSTSKKALVDPSNEILNGQSYEISIDASNIDNVTLRFFLRGIGILITEENDIKKLCETISNAELTFVKYWDGETNYSDAAGNQAFIFYFHNYSGHTDELQYDSHGADKGYIAVENFDGETANYPYILYSVRGIDVGDIWNSLAENYFEYRWNWDNDSLDIPNSIQ